MCNFLGSLHETIKCCHVVFECYFVSLIPMSQADLQVGNTPAPLYSTSYSFNKVYNCVEFCYFPCKLILLQEQRQNMDYMNSTLKYKPKSIQITHLQSLLFLMSISCRSFWRACWKEKTKYSPDSCLQKYWKILIQSTKTANGNSKTDLLTCSL